MKFFIKDFFSKCDQIRRFLRIWSYLLNNFLMKNLIFCAMNVFNLFNVNNSTPESITDYWRHDVIFIVKLEKILRHTLLWCFCC